MSIKTLRKRIALVAVSALGAGLLSVVAIAPANAATLVTIEANGGDSTGTGADSSGLLNSLDSVSSTAVAGDTDNAVEDTATTATARLQVGGRLAVTIAGATTTPVVRVTGATITNWTASGGTASSINSAGNVITSEGDNSRTLTVVITPSGAAGSQFTVEAWDTLGAADGSTAGSYRAGADAETLITVTLIAPGTQNVLSATNSLNRFSVNANTTATSLDESDAQNIQPADALQGAYINYVAYDANNVALTNKVVSCSASGTGALVAINSTSAANLLSNTASGVDADLSSGYCYVKRAVAGTAVNTTVTLTIDGVTIGSKSLTFVGDADKVLITSVARGKTDSTSTSNSAAYEFDVVDSAGNRVAGRTVTVNSGTLNSIVQAATAGTSATPHTSSTLSTGTWTCGAGAYGSADLTVYALKADGLTRVNATVKATCAGEPDTYTASLDKAVYAPGDIATLTITGKDSKGNLTNSYDDLGDSTNQVAITGSQMTAVTAPTNTDSFNASGVKTYTFLVGTTEGSYNMVVALPKWNETGVQANVVVPYKVSSGPAGVTNTEVLAAIVKLIASINKQIRALQKSLRR